MTKMIWTRAAVVVTLLSITAGCGSGGPLYEGWDLEMLTFMGTCTEQVAGLLAQPVVRGDSNWALSSFYCNDVFLLSVKPEIGEWIDHSPGVLWEEYGSSLWISAGGEG